MTLGQGFAGDGGAAAHVTRSMTLVLGVKTWAGESGSALCTLSQEEGWHLFAAERLLGAGREPSPKASNQYPEASPRPLSLFVAALPTHSARRQGRWPQPVLPCLGCYNRRATHWVA